MSNERVISMNTNIVPSTTAQFKSMRAVRDLLVKFNLPREYRKGAACYSTKQMREMQQTFDALMRLAYIDMLVWSRAQRKATGKPAKPAVYLEQNAPQIHELLLNLEAQVSALSKLRFSSDAVKAILARGRAALNEMWALSSLESEEHEIERKQPDVQPEPEQPRSWVEALAEWAGGHDEDPVGVIPEKAERAPEPKLELDPLDASGLLEALDAALAGDGLEGNDQ